jgi:hypothetical protein
LIQVTEFAGETWRTSKVTIRVLQGSMKQLKIAGISALRVAADGR